MPATQSLSSAALNVTGTGDVTALAAVGGKTLVIVAITFNVSSASVITFKNGAVALTGPMSFAQGGGFSLKAPEDVGFLWRLSPNTAFVVNQTADGLRGLCTYYAR